MNNQAAHTEKLALNHGRKPVCARGAPRARRQAVVLSDLDVDHLAFKSESFCSHSEKVCTTFVLKAQFWGLRNS